MWWMRNNWGLWGGSRLAKHFNEMGIFHADDISAIIIMSFHCRLNGRDIGLEEQLEFYKSWWARGHRVASYADVEYLRYMDLAFGMVAQ
jgi:hypothetical protein